MHPAWTYMLRDIGGSLWGVVVFALALIAPGYVTAYTSDVCEFRHRGLSEQLAWSVLLSFGVGTMLVLGAVWLGGTTCGAAVLLACGIVAAIVFSRRGSRETWSWSAITPFVLLCLFLCVIVTGSLIDIGLHSRLFMSVTAYDNALRTAFVEAVLRSGVPPANPAYWPGHDAPMRYYYFWYVLCAAVAKLAHISARQALIASSTWSIFGVLAALALFGRQWMGWRKDQLRKRWWVAVGLLGVTGVDGLVAFIVYLHSGFVARDIEWWSLDQVSSWTDTFLWVPHHAAAMVCCVSCLLLLRISLHGMDAKFAISLPVLAGVAFASACGLSTYVALGLVLILLLWIPEQLRGRNFSRAVRTLIVAAGTAAISLAPYLVQLLRPHPGARQSAGRVLTLGVRELLPPVVLAGVPGLRALSGTHPYMAREIAAGLLLIPSYFLEFGFFLIALLVSQRKQLKSSGERELLFVTWAGLLCVSIVRSRVIAMNDYSVRASLMSQFFLLLVGALALERSRALTKMSLWALLIVGASGSTYQVLLLRTYLPMHEKNGTEYAGLSSRNYALRDAYAEMQTKVARDARVQFSVPNDSYTGFAQLANAGRQVIVEADSCNDSFGGEITPCAAIQSSVAKLFSGGVAVSASQAVALCREIGADYLVASSWDSAWKQSRGWVWTLPIVVARPDVRIVSCTLPVSTAL